MRVLVTGSSGHLGEALVRSLRADGADVVGLDAVPSPWTSEVGSITDRAVVADLLTDCSAVVHCATLHKPHVETHSHQAFVETNITGARVLAEEAAGAGVEAFVYTSTTSTFGHVLHPPPNAPAAWITEDVVPLPRNVYGDTKLAAENVCESVSRDLGLPCVVLRTSRFFPEPDDRQDVRDAYDDDNIKVNELLYRRADIEDVVSAHVRALERAPSIGFGRFIVSATSPFRPEHAPALRRDAQRVVYELFPHAESIYGVRDWRMFPAIDRVYVNDRARRILGWAPRWTFDRALSLLADGKPWNSQLARDIRPKGYHRDGQIEYWNRPQAVRPPPG